MKKRMKKASPKKKMKKRGSTKPIDEKVTPLPHKPAKGDPPGCGNPICTVLDQKPVRFSSFCAYSKEMCQKSRKNQMNFIQKGDCYDIIDSKEGAKKKPWTDQELDLGDCSACRKDNYCNQTVTVNIDLKSLLFGESSGWGGKGNKVAENDKDRNKHGRLPGVPLEFPNICELMKFIQERKNVNIKTQVFGIAIGPRNEIFPTNKESLHCLWTEWFDVDTPCNTKGDIEDFSNHHQILQESFTGPTRLCNIEDFAIASQHEGGSEITRVSAKAAADGTAVGSTTDLFKQNIKYGDTSIECFHKDQDQQKLPPPFIFAEGTVGKKGEKQGGQCLDYKIRYCCKGNAMYRPQNIDYYEQYIPFKLPYGPAAAQVHVDDQNATKVKEITLYIWPTQGTGADPSMIAIFPPVGKKNKDCFLKVKDGRTPNGITLRGDYSQKKNPDGTLEIIIQVKQKKNDKHKAKIIIYLNKDLHATSVEIKTDQKVTSISQIQGGKATDPTASHNALLPPPPPLVLYLMPVGPISADVALKSDDLSLLHATITIFSMVGPTAQIVLRPNPEDEGQKGEGNVIINVDSQKLKMKGTWQTDKKDNPGQYSLTIKIKNSKDVEIATITIELGEELSTTGKHAKKITMKLDKGIEVVTKPTDSEPKKEEETTDSKESKEIKDDDKDKYDKVDKKEDKGTMFKTKITKEDKTMTIIGYILIKSSNEVASNRDGWKIEGKIDEIEKQLPTIDNKIELQDDEKNKRDSLKIKTTVTDGKGGKLEILMNTIGQFEKSIGKINVEPKKPQVWEELGRLVQTLNIDFFVDSPPLAEIFEECEWKNWVNQQYPDKNKDTREQEWRLNSQDNKKFFKHVCGDIPESAHYIDAATVEDQTPWYEAKVGLQPHEVYKLSPYHGYICDDANKPKDKEACQDMKVRYCCAKKVRAQWSDWENWTTCSKTCGGGTQTRKKNCTQIEIKGKNIHYNRLCVGEENEARRRQVSEQTQECNVKACPVKFSWTPWNAWSSCSVSCAEGTKERQRECIPPKGGGATCPEKKEDPTLYREVMNCTQTDCEKFHFSQWSDWSSCSATCGHGIERKSRGCYSNKTFAAVENHHCSNMREFFEQERKCHLGSCPIDGGWTRWEVWGDCDQKCMPHPDSIDPSQSKARRVRRRHCANPLPQYGGKPCAKDPKNKWLSHEKAEIQEKPCISVDDMKDDKLTEEDKILMVPTPYCPENCVLTEWSEWSSCSSTCVVSKLGPRVEYEHYLKSDNERENQGKHIILLPPESPESLPIRRRFRSILKKERFNGKCELFDATSQKDSMKDLFWQDEKCPLCKEHCKEEGNMEVLNWPATPYPHPKQDNCVGYCPIDCEWEQPKVTADCTLKQEERLLSLLKVDPEEKNSEKDSKADKDEEEYDYDGFDELFDDDDDDFDYEDDDDDDDSNKKTPPKPCFESHVIIELKNRKQPRKVGEAFTKELIEKIQMVRDENDFSHIPQDLEEFKSLKHIMEAKDNARLKSVAENLHTPWEKDRSLLRSLLETREETWAKVPVLDGLYGGKACERPSDKKKLTSRKDDDPKFDAAKMHNGRPLDLVISFNQCILPVCTIDMIGWKEPGSSEEDKTPCEIFLWSKWGEWGACDLKCGDKGKRIKKRECVNKCMEPHEKNENDKCSPIEIKHRNITITDEQYTTCSFCPPEDQGQWSQWTEWTLKKQ